MYSSKLNGWQIYTFLVVPNFRLFFFRQSLLSLERGHAPPLCSITGSKLSFYAHLRHSGYSSYRTVRVGLDLGPDLGVGRGGFSPGVVSKLSTSSNYKTISASVRIWTRWLTIMAWQTMTWKSSEMSQFDSCIVSVFLMVVHCHYYFVANVFQRNVRIRNVL